MKNIGIVFGSTTGTCESLAATVAEKLGVSADNVINVRKRERSQRTSV